MFFSDHHKGDGEKGSDDFKRNELIYRKALEWYFKNGYRLGLFNKKQFRNLYSKLLDYAILLKKEDTEDISNLDIDVENFLSWLAEKFEESASISLQSHQRNEESLSIAEFCAVFSLL